MVSNRDIYASAQVLIKQHGDAAEGIAMERMIKLLREDDVKGAAHWLSIMQAIEDLNLKVTQGEVH